LYQKKISSAKHSRFTRPSTSPRRRLPSAPALAASLRVAGGLDAPPVGPTLPRHLARRAGHAPLLRAAARPALHGSVPCAAAREEAIHFVKEC